VTRVHAISGSLQRGSANGALLRAVARQCPDRVSFQVEPSLASVPHFNPDHDGDAPPEPVMAWRRRLSEADAAVSATPEYAHGVPGTLKNALDWVVASGELAGKPVALLSASTAATGGIRAKLDANGELADELALRRIGEVFRVPVDEAERSVD
jgi:chromate reductase